MVSSLAAAECVGVVTDFSKPVGNSMVIRTNSAEVTVSAWDGNVAEVSVQTGARAVSEVACQPVAAETVGFSKSIKSAAPGVLKADKITVSAARPAAAKTTSTNNTSKNTSKTSERTSAKTASPTTSKATPTPAKSATPFSISFSSPDGKTSFLGMGGKSICWDESGKVTLRFSTARDDHFYGLGQPRTPDEGLLGLDFKGRTRTVWNKHWPPADLPVTFLFSPRGYGLFIDNFSSAKFDFTKDGEITYETDGGRIRFFVIAGKTPAEIISSYTKLTGRAPMPPLWSLGYMQSKYGYHDEAEFNSVMDGLRSRSIPADAMVFDIDWQGIGGMGNLEWTTESFPDPLAFNRRMEQNGFKAMVIIEPYLWTNTKQYMQARKDKLLAKDSKGRLYSFQLWGRPGVLFDFCNPETPKFWQETVRRLRLTGIDGWWTDLNEPDVDFPDMFFYGKTQCNLVHNSLPLLMSKSVADSFASNFPTERTFILSRSGGAGVAKYGATVWSGDVTSSFQHLANQIPVGMSAGISGLPMWGTDMGGFNGHPSAELFIRWFQFGLFNTMFRAHGNHDPREPWAFGPDAEKTLRETIELRYRLLPHLYSVLHQMHVSGLPPMRPLFLNFPTDKQSWLEVGEYMFGDSILTAPVVKEGDTSKRVYFPPGTWYDFHTDRTYSGPATITYPAPIETVPIFVRAGGIIPMTHVVQHTELLDRGYTELHVFPGTAKSTYDLYEDDGASNDYKNGKFAVTTISVSPTADGFNIDIAKPQGDFPGLPLRRSWVVVLHEKSSKTLAVSENGNSLQKLPSAKPLPPDSASWTIDAATGRLMINLPMTPSGTSLKVKVKK